MVQAELGTLRALIRTRTNDQGNDGDPPFVVQDWELDTFLNQHRTEMRYVPFRPLPDFAPGHVTYVTFASMANYWDDGTLFIDAGWNDIGSTVADWNPITGVVTFSAQPAGLSVRARGHTYDLYAVIGDVFTAWASKVMLEHDFTAEKGAFSRSQQHAMLSAQAQAAYRLAEGGTGYQWQSDAAPQTGYAGVVYPALGTSGPWGPR